MKHLIEKFTAVDDSGSKYEIRVYKTVIENEYNPRADIANVPGHFEYETSAGFEVRHLGSETYEITSGRKRLRKL